MIGALTSALGGLSTAAKQADGAATRIAESSVSRTPDSMIEDIVDLKSAAISFKANAAALRVAEDMMEETIRLFDRQV